MDLKELSYFLYMESMELKSKEYDNLTEYEKVNMELNPFLDENIVTKRESFKDSSNYPESIPLSTTIKNIDINKN